MDDKLAELTSEIKKCEACHLKENRIQVVPGVYGPKIACVLLEKPLVFMKIGMACLLLEDLESYWIKC